MSNTLLLSVPVDGSNSLVAISLIGHDHQIARTLGHKPGTGRWIDQYEVRRYGDDSRSAADGEVLVQRHVAQRKSLELARQLASKLYQDACARVAAHRWAEAEAALGGLARRADAIDQAVLGSDPR